MIADDVFLLLAEHSLEEVAIRDSTGQIVELFGAPTRETAESRLQSLGYVNRSGWFDSASGSYAWVSTLPAQPTAA